MKTLLSACMLGLIASVIVCSDVPSKNLFTPAYSQSEGVEPMKTIPPLDSAAGKAAQEEASERVASLGRLSNEVGDTMFVMQVQCRDCYQPQRRRARRPRRQRQCPTCY
jgi:hypothetical protein